MASSIQSLLSRDKGLRNGSISNPCCVYVGSSNLTRGGLSTNIECGFLAEAEGCPKSASAAFGELWNLADQATADALRHYSARFADCARRRSASELADLGINDTRFVETSPSGLKSLSLPSRPALADEFAVSAWTGLQSFTGEYRFQIEFPKNAGKVISQLIRTSAKLDGNVAVYCPDDGSTRTMKYRFYQDNGMFRLNVPNDLPGVDWARSNHDGIALVEPGPHGGAQLRLRLLRPGGDVADIIGRSVALGTWGKTTTRYYGWF